MHPIEPIYFGNNLPTSLSIQFYNGTQIVNGFILKQVGTSRYIVSDGSNTIIATLAQDTASASVVLGETNGDLVLGDATIAYTSDGTTWIYIKKLTSKLAYTTDGEVYQWVVSGQPVPDGGIALSSPF